ALAGGPRAAPAFSRPGAPHRRRQPQFWAGPALAGRRPLLLPRREPDPPRLLRTGTDAAYPSGRLRPDGGAFVRRTLPLEHRPPQPHGHPARRYLLADGRGPRPALSPGPVATAEGRAAGGPAVPVHGTAALLLRPLHPPA